MKVPHTFLAGAVAFGLTSLSATAQEPKRDGPPPGRMPPPLMAALDANKDGEIDAAEMANASVALKTLDKNNDGKLTGEEIRPPRGDRGPGGPGGPKDGDRGPGGPRGPKDGERGPGGPEGDKK